MTPTKDRLLNAAEARFLQKGYTATTVDEICREAGTTKGAFFHHFDNKLDVALRAVQRHANRRFDAFAQRAEDLPDPRARVLAYIDGMLALALRVERPACLVTALTLELADVEPKVYAECSAAFGRWTDDLVALISAARGADGPSAESLAHQVMSTFQGAMVVARAKRQPEVLEQAMAGLRAYVASVLPERPATAA